MAIAFVAFTQLDNGATKENPHTYTNGLTVASGTDLILIITVMTGDNDGITTSAVTFNGDSLTKRLDSGASTDYSVWYRVNPDVATGDVVVTSTSTDTRANVAALVYSGVDQSTIFTGTDSTETRTAQSTIVTPSITPGSDNSMVVGGAWGQVDVQSLTFNTGDNERYNFTGFSGQAFERNVVAGEDLQTTAAAATLDWTGGSSWEGVVWILALLEAAAAGPANMKSWNGLAIASIKSINGVAIASVKKVNGVA